MLAGKVPLKKLQLVAGRVFDVHVFFLSGRMAFNEIQAKVLQALLQGFNALNIECHVLCSPPAGGTGLRGKAQLLPLLRCAKLLRPQNGAIN